MSETGPHQSLFLGIDGGGTKCLGRLVDASGRVLGEGLAGSANAFQNLQGTRASIVNCAEAALASAGIAAERLDELVVVAGLAGVNVPRCHSAMTQWSHPFARFEVFTDIHIACVAAHGGEGAIIVVGTGSVGYNLVDGKGHSYGGHGFTLGDQGSGAWLGRRALQAVMLAGDELGPATQLTGLAQAQLGVSGLEVVDVMSAASSREFGAFAPLVIAAAEEGDEVARSILDEGAAYLDAMAMKMLAAGAERLSLLGGLANIMAARMSKPVKERLAPALAQSEEGAVRLALRLQTGQ
ncbi:BadF/BadG/BcrA/BcrD ATPase family protein [Halioglobus maricola]|nr:BadF/BadG/BcrA/BcrD ATPase family protein [Halioglobus maricola]